MNQERSEAATNPSESSPTNGDATAVGSRETVLRAQRRQFTVDYKMRIVREAELARDREAIGALLRREGLYASHLSSWRRLSQEGAREKLKSRKRGPVAKRPSEAEAKVTELERENARLCKKLENAEIIIDFQKKLAQILGIELQTPPNVKSES